MENQRTSLYYYLAVLAAIFLWGVNIVSLKILVTAFDPVAMTSFRIMTAGLFLVMIHVFLKNDQKMTKKEWLYIAMGGILGVFAHHLFLSVGLTTIPASTAVLILGLVPVATAICSSIFLRESFSIWRIIGILFAFIGIIFVQGGLVSITTGAVFLFVAVIVQAVSFLFIRKASETLSSLQITSTTLVIGAVLLFVVSFSVEPAGVQTFISGDISLYTIFLFSAIGSTACGQLLFNVSIQRIGPSKSALFLNFVPFIGLLCSAVFLDERIYWYHWCGFLFIVLGVLFGTGYIERTWGHVLHRVKKTA